MLSLGEGPGGRAAQEHRSILSHLAPRKRRHRRRRQRLPGSWQSVHAQHEVGVDGAGDDERGRGWRGGRRRRARRDDARWRLVGGGESHGPLLQACRGACASERGARRGNKMSRIGFERGRERVVASFFFFSTLTFNASIFPALGHAVPPLSSRTPWYARWRRHARPAAAVSRQTRPTATAAGSARAAPRIRARAGPRGAPRAALASLPASRPRARAHAALSVRAQFG